MSDNLQLTAYCDAMERGEPIIRVRLNVDQPIELGDFVSAFTSVAAEYDRFVRVRVGPDAAEATLYVQQVRQGSIIADLVPLLVGGGLLATVEAFNKVDEFVERLGKRLKTYSRPGGRLPDATKSELNDFSAQVAAIANNPGSTLEVAAIQIERGEERVSAAFKFSTSEAREIQQRVEEHIRELDHSSRADHERVLMVFTRSDVRTTPIGKRSGEQVVIESLSESPRPLIYASEVAEFQIKREITETEENVFKKGFVVDVNVESRNGKPVAYSVTNLHQVIDLPDD